MITHLVSWKLRDDVDREASIARTRDLLLGLVGVVDSIRTIDVIENVAFPEVNHDLAVLATFDDVAGLEAFASNPTHLAAVAEIHTFITERGGIDWTARPDPADLAGTVDERMRQLEHLTDGEQSSAWLRRQLDIALAAWASDESKLDIDREARSDF